MRRLLWVLFCGLLLLPAAAIEVTDDLTPEQEARYRALANQLRCLVCQNQTLSDSGAGLAGDMRAVLRSKIKAGEDDEAIVQFLTERYGDFVLYRPPWKPQTVLLWVLPFVVLFIGIAVFFAVTRRRGAVELTADERVRVEELLKK